MSSSLNRIDMFRGLRLIENINLTIPGPIVDSKRWVRRTWKERLFSQPWHPFVSTKEIVEKIQTQLPDPQYYIMENQGCVVAHPETMKKLKKILENPNEYYHSRF